MCSPRLPGNKWGIDDCRGRHSGNSLGPNLIQKNKDIDIHEARPANPPQETLPHKSRDPRSQGKHWTCTGKTFFMK